MEEREDVLGKRRYLWDEEEWSGERQRSRMIWKEEVVLRTIEM
jgi:hypothetical protein